MKTLQAIETFITNIGKHREAEFWLQLFRSTAKERFATLMLEEQVLQDALEAVILDLRFLKAVGLLPIVTLDVHLSPEKSQRYLEHLHRKLAEAHIRAEILPYTTPESCKLEISRCLKKEHIPLIKFPTNAAGNFTYIANLVSILESKKLIFLNHLGPLTYKGVPVPLVDIEREYAKFRRAPFTPRQKLFLAEAKYLLLQVVEHKLLVTLTSPFELLRELFTVKGAGTLLRRSAKISCTHGFSQLDQQKLAILLTKSFGRKPKPAFFKQPVDKIYLIEGYLGAAITMDTPLGCYLSKFAVATKAQGEGLGRDLWWQLTANRPALYWRSRPQNPINPWYLEQCDGCHKTPKWLCFWKNMPATKIPELIAYCLQHPDDLQRLRTPREFGY